MEIARGWWRAGARTTVTAVVVTVLAACGGGGDDDDQRSSATTTTEATEPSRTEREAETSTTAPTTTSTTTAPPPPPIEEVDLRAVPLRIRCFDGELDVVAGAPSTPSPSGPVKVDLFEVTYADADADGRSDAVVRATCVFADGGNASVASVAVVGATAAGPVQLGQPVDGFQPEVVDGTLVVAQAVYGDGDPNCCPSAFRHVPFGLADGRWAEAPGDGVAGDAVTTGGLGALAVGSRYAEVAGRSGRPLLVEDPLQTDGACTYVSFDDLEGVVALGGEGLVHSVQVTSSAVRTRSGLGVGARAEDVYAAFPGRVIATPHEYVPGGEYLTFTPVDEPDRLVVFETDGATVTAFRAGESGWASAIEGCA